MRILLRIALIASLLMAASASANEERNKEVNYIPVKPSFVTNYESANGRLSYLKIDISVRVESLEHTEIVERHRPHIRHRIIMYLTQQTAATVNSPEGRQQLREQSLQIVQELMTEEEGQPIITDLLFDNFVVQG